MLAEPRTEDAPAPAAALDATEVRPVSMPFVDRLASAVITGVPPVILLIGMYFGWTSHMLIWQDLLVLAVMYVGVGAGVTVGFHRLLTHRSFKTYAPLRALWAILGSAAVEGPVIDWVATHRKHHQYSDCDGDPHSPHVDHRRGWRGALRGLVYAHVGWVFSDMEVADEQRYAKDLLADPVVTFVDRTFVLWVIAGLVSRSALGVPLTGTVTGGARRPAVGRRGADLPRAPRDVQHQLDLSLLRLPDLRHRRRVPQRRVACDPDVGRVLAQQPPRVPDELPARLEPLADRPVRRDDPADGDGRTRLGRHPS